MLFSNVSCQRTRSVALGVRYVAFSPGARWPGPDPDEPGADPAEKAAVMRVEGIGVDCGLKRALSLHVGEYQIAPTVVYTAWALNTPP
eukprot:3408584-Prymnesium_polylepis.1